jgi:hypothetical protein
MGAEAIRELLQKLELESLSVEMRDLMKRSHERPEAKQNHQAPQGRRGVPQLAEQARVDDP